VIVGIIGDDGVPFIEIPIGGKKWKAIIDTGFNGALELPEELRSSLNPRFICRIRSLLAGGQILEENAYVVDIVFDGKRIPAEATFAPTNELLIGTGLLKEHRLEVVFPRKTLVLERLSLE
jgi:predicted aspartyl protease